MKKRELNLNISLLRTIFCIAILFYHLTILKGGYLAVCSFFALAGYFSCRSLEKNKSLVYYYFKRIKKIVLPLFLFVFLSIAIINIFNITVFNMKPEVVSILLGYNNYWQINANVDYFAKHLNSPFFHLWYIAILIQLELAFPLIFVGLKKLEERYKEWISLIIILVLSIGSMLFFYFNTKNGNIMFSYYDTLSRLFSFGLGFALGLFHVTFRRTLTIKFNNIVPTAISIFYIIALLFLFIFVDSSSKYYAISMIGTTFVTLRLIEYSIMLKHRGIYINNKVINFISNISYEVYLVQYLFIFLFTNVNMNGILKNILIIILTFLLSFLIHESLRFIKRDRFKLLRNILRVILVVGVLYGIYGFIVMKDSTGEINELKDKLSNNEKIMQEKQEEYKKKQAEEKAKQDEEAKKKAETSVNVDEYISNLKLVGVGDSVMLNAIPGLYEVFPNGYFDAAENRTTYGSYEILEGIRNQGIEWDAVIFNIGTNGETYSSYKDSLLELIGDHDIFWLTATEPDYPDSNEKLLQYASEHPNVHILDWSAVANGNNEWLYSDNTHLKPEGLDHYVDFIKTEIYKYYSEKLNTKTDTTPKQVARPDKISFYGNKMLVSIYDQLQAKYSDSYYEGKETMTFSELYNSLNEQKNNNTLSSKLVFIFDKNSKFTDKEYDKIIELCEGSSIFIINVNKKSLENTANVININKKDYFMSDGVTLNNEGTEMLINKLTEMLDAS